MQQDVSAITIYNMRSLTPSLYQESHHNLIVVAKRIVLNAASGWNQWTWTVLRPCALSRKPSSESGKKKATWDLMESDWISNPKIPMRTEEKKKKKKRGRERDDHLTSSHPFDEPNPHHHV